MVGILLASLIWWDHPNLFNHLSFPYIKMHFSCKRRRLMKVDSSKIIIEYAKNWMSNSTSVHT